MNTTTKSTKQHLIVADLRRQVVSGELAPGVRLPSYPALAAHYGVTGVTLSRAISQLAQEGFVAPRQRSGVYVSHTLPHLSNIGLAFHHHPSQGDQWLRLWDIMQQEAQQGLPGLARQFHLYYHITGDRQQPDYLRLAADLAGQRLGGLIFASHPWHLYGTPVLQASDGVPRLALMGGAEVAGVGAVNFAGYLEQVLDLFQAQGRRRLAVITTPGMASPPWVAALTSGAAARGLDLRPYWLHTVSLAHPHSAASLTHLLFSGPANTRPDALLVADDNLVDPALQGLLRAPVRVPEEVLVVGHCNFPPPSASRLPIQRVGYDIRALLTTCVALLDQARAGAATPPLTMLPAIFETDFRRRWTTTATAEPKAEGS